MIVCSNCETSQFLQITQSRVFWVNGEGIIDEISESYECTMCGATGKYTWDDAGEEESVTGDLDVDFEERPVMA